MSTDVRDTTEFAFLVLIVTIIVMPLLAQRVRLPSLVGLLIGGVIVSPNGLGILNDLGAISAIGDIGLLYLMFLAGIGLDMKTFERYRSTAIAFGLITATLPWLLGTGVARIEGFGWPTALLLGSFWASFTLVAYSTIKQYDLTRNPSMAATVGAVAITDTLSLVALGVIVGVEVDDDGGLALIGQIALGLAVVLGYSLIVVRRIAKWFFAGLGQDRELRFVMTLGAFLSAAVVAERVGIEPLLGAFFAGLGMNRLVPNQSALMGRIEFFGNALFVPAFLVSVGVLIDPAVLASWDTIRLGLLFTVALVVGKALAALITGRVFSFAWPDVGMMFSLSIAQAAATLAAAVVGLDAGLFDETVLNAVMVVVAISLLVSTVGSNWFGARMTPFVSTDLRLGERIVVPVSGSASNAGTLDLAGRIASSDGGVLIPLVVSVTSEPERLNDRRADLDAIRRMLGRLGLTSDPELRVDRSIAGGVDRVATESNASLVLLTRPGRRNLRELMFGGTNDEIAAAVERPVAVVSLTESRAAAREIPLDGDDRHDDRHDGHGDDERNGRADRSAGRQDDRSDERPDHRRRDRPDDRHRQDDHGDDRGDGRGDDRGEAHDADRHGDDQHGEERHGRRGQRHADRSEWYGRILLAATSADFSPGLVADLRLAAELAGDLDESTHHHLAVGPIDPEALRSLDVELPETITHLEAPDDRDGWIDTHVTEHDLLIVPARGNPFATLDTLHRPDRSIVAVALRHDPRWYRSEESIGVTVPR